MNHPDRDPGAAAAPRTDAEDDENLVEPFHPSQWAGIPATSWGAAESRASPLTLTTETLAEAVRAAMPWAEVGCNQAAAQGRHDRECPVDRLRALIEAVDHPDFRVVPAAEDRGLAALRAADLDAAWDAHLTEELGSGHECSRYCAEDLVRFYNAALPHGEPARTPETHCAWFDGLPCTHSREVPHPEHIDWSDVVRDMQSRYAGEGREPARTAGDPGDAISRKALREVIAPYRTYLTTGLVLMLIDDAAALSEASSVREPEETT